MKTVIDPNVFIEAAEAVDRESCGCCSAIMDAGNQSEGGPENRFFAEWFRPEHESIHTFWWGLPWWRSEQQARVFALLLAAILAEEEFS
jgi:hypothetical protein